MKKEPEPHWVKGCAMCRIMRHSPPGDPPGDGLWDDLIMMVHLRKAILDLEEAIWPSHTK